jgi:hypothetical protein
VTLARVESNWNLGVDADMTAVGVALILRLQVGKVRMQLTQVYSMKSTSTTRSGRQVRPLISRCRSRKVAEDGGGLPRQSRRKRKAPGEHQKRNRSLLPLVDPPVLSDQDSVPHVLQSVRRAGAHRRPSGSEEAAACVLRHRPQLR